MIRVLFVCSGNSARSQMAEAVLRHEAGDRFEVASAGTNPRPIHPLAIRVLAEAGLDITGATSKSTTRYLGQRFDYVITLCDRARAECPIFPGAGETLHWGLDDPAEVEGTDERRLEAFRHALTEVSGRIRAFVPLAEVAAAR